MSEFVSQCCGYPISLLSGSEVCPKCQKRCVPRKNVDPLATRIYADGWTMAGCPEGAEIPYMCMDPWVLLANGD